MIRFATIGTSTITRTFLDAATDVAEVRVTTAYSRDGERAEKFAREQGLPESSCDLAALYESGSIDAVYVASPNAIHFEQAHQAIEAGMHVLVEKPAVTTAADFTTLVEAAAARGVLVLEAMRSAYDPGLHAVGRLKEDLGQLRRASLSYCQRSARYEKVLAGETVNIFDPALAGGALFDLGVYCTSAMIGLFGEPDHVLAASVPIRGGSDGAGAALAVYPGFVVDISYSKITASSRANEIQGEQGTLTFDSITQPTNATLTTLDGAESRHAFPGPENNMVHQIRRFAGLIDDHADGDLGAWADHEHTLATLRVIEAIQAAASRV